MTYLITELCVGGELKQVLQQKQFFPEEEARHIIGCLADAITYLHKKSNTFLYTILSILCNQCTSLSIDVKLCDAPMLGFRKK